VQSLNPTTAQAILDRAARLANRNRGAAPTALFTNTTAAPNHPNSATAAAPALSGATAHSDSDEEETEMATTTTDPLAYSSAFKESEFILKQVMKL
jgi:hypothetical protein